MRLLIAATGLNNSITQQVLACHEAGVLSAFHTSMVFPNGHWLPKAVPKLASRQLGPLPVDRTMSWPWLELVRLACVKAQRSGIMADRVWEWSDHIYSQRIGRKLDDVDAVMSPEHASLESFVRARELGVMRIYSVPAAYSGLVRGVLQEEFNRFPELREAQVPVDREKEARRQERRNREFEMADLVISHSSFTKRSYVDAGFPAEKIAVVPYGSEPVNAQALAELGGGPKVPERPRFLFAGNFAVHKGAHILLDAWRALADRRAELLIAGTVFLPQKLKDSLPPGVKFLGRLPWGELQQLYATCTALVFPTLSDGFGLVVTEALANGLPVITTPNAGAADLLVHGESGMIVPIVDAPALTDAMRNLIDDPILAWRMRQGAIRVAARWQWSEFRAMHSRTIIDAYHAR